MYSALLAAHNVVRWLVLLAGIWAAVRAWRGWMARGTWSAADHSAGRAFVNLISLQLVLGLALYAVSPLIRQGIEDMSAAMRTPSIRYFLVEHVVMMLIAVALAHVGLARVNKAASDSARFQAAAIWWGIATAAVAGFIPWNRPFWPF
jgi:hypothetical protein